MKAWHMLVCAGLVLAGIALAASGTSSLALVPVLGCALMMGAMVVMMMRGGGGH